MKARFSTPFRLFPALALALPVSAGLASAAPAKPPAPAAAPAVEPAEVPQSVFVAPATAKEGRNPFFPKSTLGQQQIKQSPTGPDIFSSLVLNGITSPPKRTAMINGKTFEQGEESEVKLPGGAKVNIKVEEIKNDSAVVTVNGQRRELRLRFGV